MFRAVKLLCDTSPSVNPTRAEDLGDDDASVQVRRLQHRCPRKGRRWWGRLCTGGCRGISASSSQFCYDPKIALKKIKSIKETK